MTEADVRDISATCCESEGNRSKAITMLNMWHDQHGSEGTVRRLCATSLKVERRAAAEGVFGKDIVDVVNREIASEKLKISESMESKLRSLAKSIGTKWPDLAIRLGVSDEDVKMTKADRKSIKDQAYRMLTDWYYNKGSQASIAEVEETVKAIQSQTAKSETIFPAGLRREEEFHGRTQELHDLKHSFWGYNL
jgi:phage terminase large subunit-like protein